MFIRCSQCCNLTEIDPVLCTGKIEIKPTYVLSKTKRYSSMERTKEYKGLYHINGAISPMVGIVL